MKVLVAGGTGFIGRALCRDLAVAGHRVALISRSASSTVPGAGETFSWDGPWRLALEETDVIVNLAGENIAAGRWTEARKKALRDSRLETTRALALAVGSARRPPAFISASAVGYYGDRGDEELIETSPPGTDFLADLCRDWETEALRAEGPGRRIVLARIGVVLGSGGGALAKMLPPFKLGLGGPLGPGRQFMPWIHLDDAVGLLRLAVERSDASGPVNLTAPEPVTNEQFSRALASALRRPCAFRVPTAVLRLVAGELADVLLSSQRVLPKAAGRLGYVFRYPELGACLRACV